MFLAILAFGQMGLSGQAAKGRQASESDTVIPHIAFGGDWKTVVTLVNTEASDTDVVVRFYDSNGVPLPAPTDTKGATAAYQVRVPANGSHQFLISGGASVMQGWADVTFDTTIGDVRGSAVFRQSVAGRQDLEALSPSCPNTWMLRVPFDETQGYQTGLATANPNAAANVVSAIVRGEDGKALNSEPIQIHLAPMGHTAFLVSTHPLLSKLVKGRGVIDLSGTDRFAAMGLRFSPTFSFTTILPYEFSY